MNLGLLFAYTILSLTDSIREPSDTNVSLLKPDTQSNSVNAPEGTCSTDSKQRNQPLT